MPKYTVIGFYDDNRQPCVHAVVAASPRDAAKITFEEMTPGLQIVEVFKGDHMGLLGNDEVLTNED
jgi:hypothetical protein